MGDTIVINGKKFIDVEAFFDRIVKAKTDYLYPNTIATMDDDEVQAICQSFEQIGEGELADVLRNKYIEKRWIKNINPA